MRFKDKVALITAAGRGIGRATAEIIGREGGTVVAIDNDKAALEQVLGAIRGAGGTAHGLTADALDAATGRLLDENKSPARRLGQIDKRGSHCFLAMAWAEALAAQNDDPELAATFAPVAEALVANRDAIEKELIDDQGHPNDIGGYFQPDPHKASAAMRPSATFNAIIERLVKTR